MMQLVKVNLIHMEKARVKIDIRLGLMGKASKLEFKSRIKDIRKGRVTFWLTNRSNSSLFPKMSLCRIWNFNGKENLEKKIKS